MITLKANELRYQYPDGTQALNGVDLDVVKGEILAVLGANGSGKTTLLKHLNYLLRPTSGTVTLAGKKLCDYKPCDIFKKVGMVFQDPNDQLIAPTVEEDIAFGPTNLNLNNEEILERVSNALDLVNMREYSKKTIHALSYGQRKRICIAGILAMGPELLILDEPTSGLDPVGVRLVMKLLKELNEDQGITIIIATNSVDLVPVFMDRVVIMNKGSVVLEGTPDSVFTGSLVLKEMQLELPQIAQLMEVLRERDKFPINNLPLTVGHARQELVKLMNPVALEIT